MQNRNNQLWNSSAKEAPLESTKPNQNESVDLLIIGGGYTGVSAAREASKAGASVCLLEAKTIGFGGSGRNVGLVNAGLWLPPEDIKKALGEKEGSRLITALYDSPDLVFNNIEESNIQCEPTRNGTLHCAHSASGLKELQNRLRQSKEIWPQMALFDANETQTRTGTSVYHGSLFNPKAGTIQPLAYCRGMARSAQQYGAKIFEHAPVSSLQFNNDQWQANIDNYEIKANKILFATNAYHQGIENIYKPQFIPMHYFQMATEPMSDVHRAEILSGGEGCWDTDLIMSSFRTDQAGRMIIGGLGNLMGVGNKVHSLWARRKLKQLFPSISNLNFEYACNGSIAVSNDYTPKILSIGENAYASFGYSGRGIGPGTVFGKMISESLLQENPDLLPIKAQTDFNSPFRKARAAYYEFGAISTHCIKPLPFVN
jgi:glycine/D-amino acid oxidase-like deaminating enzyme